MTFDAKVPLQLKNEQMWFGTVIGRPFDDNSNINRIAPSGELIELEALDHILPSPTLRPAQRIQIYNQQYWWRLINTMHSSFPLLTRMLGFYNFNRSLCIPYLVKYPPRHWSLSHISEFFPKWILEDYQGNDKQLIADAASLDWAFVHSFIAAQMTPLFQECEKDAIDPETLSTKTLYTQPHLHLFKFSYNLPKYRTDLLEKDHDYWLATPLPLLEKTDEICFVYYRNNENNISWKDIDLIGYLILKQFQSGASIDSIAEWLETQDQKVYEIASTHMQEWFQEWTARGWLTLARPTL